MYDTPTPTPVGRSYTKDEDIVEAAFSGLRSEENQQYLIWGLADRRHSSVTILFDLEGKSPKYFVSPVSQKSMITT